MKSHRYKPGESKIVLERHRFTEEAGRCMACGATHRGLAVHEIARGADRGRAFRNRVAWLCVCWPCNCEMTIPTIWPVARQLALKVLADPAFYDLVEFNRLRIVGGDPTRGDRAIEQSEVDAYLDTVFVTYSKCEG